MFDSMHTMALTYADLFCSEMQCMSPATRLKILRERMAGNKASAHSLVQQEFELMSLTAIEVSPSTKLLA